MARFNDYNRPSFSAFHRVLAYSVVALLGFGALVILTSPATSTTTTTASLPVFDDPAFFEMLAEAPEAPKSLAQHLQGMPLSVADREMILRAQMVAHQQVAAQVRNRQTNKRLAEGGWASL